MAAEPPGSPSTTVERIFQLLDHKLISFGIPGAIGFGGITNATAGLWRDAIACFVAAAIAWVAIELGKKLAPKLGQLIDWLIAAAEQALIDLWAQLRSDFTARYLRQQTRLCEEFIVEGFNPDRTAIPLLEEVFVPLDLSGAISSGALDKGPLVTRDRWQNDPSLQSENLDIWQLLARTRKDRKFRQMSILAKGGMGKTTLLRHISLIYGQGKYRRHRAPRLVPMLLRLRDWVDILTHPQPPSLPHLITDHYLPHLSKNHPLVVPPVWAAKLLTQGKALVMFDGFDEIPSDKRPQVSRWLSDQMAEYAESVFILTSRPAGYRDYVAQKPTIPIYVNKFNPDQQSAFIRRWYLCQERCCRSERQRRQAQAVATERANNLLTQLHARRDELGYMAENPLLLNMLVTYHRYDPVAELPRQRLGLYRRICDLQLDARPRARLIPMPLPYRKSMALLQSIAIGMVTSKAKRLTINRATLLHFLSQHRLLRDEEVDPADWLRSIVDISELLVEREPNEFEFPHASFQGFFAATWLAKSEDKDIQQQHSEMVLQNWNEALWRETVLLYTAQLAPGFLNQVIRQACALDGEAAELAAVALREYPRPDKVQDDLKALLKDLEDVTQDSKYQRLERLLQDCLWQEADQETYRLMITTVGKEEGQWFDRQDLINFPYTDLKAINALWTKHSRGKFGFSVQKKIYKSCGATLDGEYPGDQIWHRFCDRIGWRYGGRVLKYSRLRPNLESSPDGLLPAAGGATLGGKEFWALLSGRDL
ncbi:MAG TPA: GUN4 domain-containing protein [Nodosilinea sp.]|nr:GUN4 domain-containing protein [Nodosilinea sp.]